MPREPTGARPILWIFNQYSFPPDTGGLTRPFDFATRIAALGVDVTIFAASFNHYSRRDERLRRGQLLAEERYGQVRFVWLRTPPYRRNGPRRVVNVCAYAVMSVLAQARYPRPDAVLGSSAHLLAPLAAFITARARGSRFYFEVGDIWPQSLIDVGALRPDQLVTRGLESLETFLYRRAERIIGVLPGMAEYVAGRGISPTKVVYVPNGADPDATRDEPRSPAGLAAVANIRARKARGRCVAIYAGAHGLMNRLEVIVRAAHALERGPSPSPVDVLLMGDGPDKPRLVALGRYLGLRNIAFLDPVPKSEATAVIAQADVGLVSMRELPVYRYGISPNKVFDYFNAGIPVAMAASSPRDPVTRAGAGIVTPAEDFRALARAILALVALTPEERATMGTRGRRLMREEHDLDVLALRLADAMGLRPSSGDP